MGNYIWLLTGEFLSKVFVFLFTVFVARKLEVADFGRYSFSLSLVLILSLAVDFGLTTLITRETSRDRSLTSIYMSNIFLIRVFLSFAIYLFIFLILHFLRYPSDTILLTSLLWIWITFKNLSYVFRGVFNARERMFYESFLNYSHEFLRLILVFVFFFFGFELLAVGSAMLIASIFTLFISYIIYMRYFEPWEWKIRFSFWPNLLKESLPIALTSIFFVFFGRIDNILISYIHGDEPAGIYNASFSLVWALILVPGYVTHAAFPKLSQYATSDRQKLKILTACNLKIISALCGVMILIIFSYSDILIQFIYGHAYLSSVRILQILIFSLPSLAVTNVFIYLLNAVNLQRMNALILGVALLIYLPMDFLFISLYGPLGAAFTTLFSTFLLAALFFIFCVRASYIDLAELKPSLTDIKYFKHFILR